ncbi:formimidoylglutamase [Neobacillus piezotolerans]|uniref:Formimidoylglutamase n=1 Tax=Neobacillus piezotolerans TaxID=2259171 RepID=A0A3D8GPU8_9BACI|nr:agmatinase family protein [Neobacillus piezotolerans]RDU36504.1 formimidoylglutamase [Neobacillus piezotolerans]
MLRNYLEPTQFAWRRDTETKDPKVKDWIFQAGGDFSFNEGGWDIAVLGVPLSRSSISVSGASEFPEAFRRAWGGFSTYNLDYGTDLKELKVLDLGNVKMHFTDIARSHDNITQAMKYLKEELPDAFPVSIGGDHSVTARLISGLKAAHPGKEIGILQFDTHLDLRDLADHGPTNGTPIRYLIENGIIQGKNVFNIGLHGFFNGQTLLAYAKEHSVNYITLREARKKGIAETVREAVAELSERVDLIYVTIDMDVLDIAFAQGVPASTPGGMSSHELLEGVYEAGLSGKVGAMDIVCLDPTKDTPALATVKTGVYTFLTFLTGVKNREA